MQTFLAADIYLSTVMWLFFSENLFKSFTFFKNFFVAYVSMLFLLALL